MVFADRNPSQDPRKREERLKLAFDYSKNLTTLIVGTAVVLVAISQAAGLQPLQIVGSLVFFAIAAMLTLYSMMGLIHEIGSDSYNSEYNLRSWWRWMSWPILLELATGLYLNGVILLFVFAIAARF